MKKKVLFAVVFWVLGGLPGRAGFVDTPPALLQDHWEPVHEQVLAVKYVNRVLQNARREWPARAFHVRSPDDPSYAEPQAVIAASYWVRPVRYTIRKPLNVKHTWVFLTLPHPMQPGAEYIVTETNLAWRRLQVRTGEPIPHVREPTPPVSGIWHGDQWHLSPALSVNQLGYLPAARKYGYLTQFAGHPTAVTDERLDVDFSHRDVFKVLDADTGAVRWSGTVKPADPEGNPDPLSESRVWLLDFSAFQTPGRYRLHVPGVGVSFPFQIDAAVYNQAFGLLMRGAYHQRCGTALDMPWTRHTHPACHLDDARVPLLVEYNRPTLEFLPQQEGAVFDCAGGHHDAGDFGKYTINGALFAYAILQAFEVYPGRLQYDQSPVPEAGNGRPDLIEEVMWELTWLTGMQDPADGGVHIIVKPDPTMSYEDGVAGRPTSRFDKQRALWWKDIHATAAFAAIMARAARAPEIRDHWPEKAERYLAQARKAWAFCMRHTDPDGTPRDMVGGHHYGAFLGARDEYNWMAVELWLTTGEPDFHAYFLAHHDPEEAWNWGWWPLKDAAGAATRSYVYGHRPDKDPEMLRRCRDGRHGVLDAARTTRDWQSHWAFRSSFSPVAHRFGRWGWYFLSDIASYDLLLAASLVEGEEKESFIQAALFNADQEFGNAPDNRTAFTGIGARRPVDIVHQNARFDGIVEPIPGIPLGFHPAGFNRGTSDRALIASYLVGDLPIAYRYVDDWNIEQEFTVDNFAKTLMTYAMLGRADLQRGGFPSVRLTANGHAGRLQGEAPFTVTFQAEGEGASGKEVREYFWDLTNEELFPGPVVTYTFHEPGRYEIVCTATDDAGWPAFASIEILVQEPETARPNQGRPWASAANTFALWRFDGALTDEVARHPATLTGNAALSDENVLWMTRPGGQAVRVGGVEDGVRLPLPPDLFADERIQAVTVDAMIQYEADVPRGQGHSRLFMLYGHWDSQLGLHRDSWAGKQLLGVPEGEPQRPLLNARMATIFKPQPGWKHLQFGYDRRTGKAFMSLDGEELEWRFDPPRARREVAVYIGGFIGYIDEVRITIDQEAAQ